MNVLIAGLIIAGASSTIPQTTTWQNWDTIYLGLNLPTLMNQGSIDETPSKTSGTNSVIESVASSK